MAPTRSATKLAELLQTQVTELKAKLDLAEKANAQMMQRHSEQRIKWINDFMWVSFIGVCIPWMLFILYVNTFMF